MTGMSYKDLSKKRDSEYRSHSLDVTTAMQIIFNEMVDIVIY